MWMARKRIWERRGVTCALYYVRHCHFIFASTPLLKEWRNSGRAQWQHRRRTYPSNYGIMLLRFLATRLDWTLSILLVDADFVTHEKITSKKIEK